MLCETNTAGKGNSMCWGNTIAGVTRKATFKPRLEKGGRASVILVDILGKVPGSVKATGFLLPLTSQDSHFGKQFKTNRAG